MTPRARQPRGSAEQSQRSYGQFCGLARALDVVGDRWTLLIVRELLVEPRRYSDLRVSLAGIASNVLAERLRELVRDELVVQRAISHPAPAVLYELTERGRHLEQAIAALVRWSAPLMQSGRRGDAFDPRWLVIAFRALLAPVLPKRASTLLEFVVGSARFVVRYANGRLQVEPLHDSLPDAITIETTGEAALQLAAGVVTLSTLIRERRATASGPNPSIRAASQLLSLAARRPEAA